MNSPQPVPPNLTPSGSTNMTVVGGSIASIIVWLLSLKGVFLPAGLEAAVATLVAALAGYIPKSGRA